MAISPDDFDIPVKDYDYANISTPKSLIDQMASAGGFTATKLATARNILQDMKGQIDGAEGDSSKVCNWISFPACFANEGCDSIFLAT